MNNLIVHKFLSKFFLHLIFKWHNNSYFFGTNLSYNLEIMNKYHINEMIFKECNMFNNLMFNI
jgi:hypothetical protein